MFVGLSFYCSNLLRAMLVWRRAVGVVCCVGVFLYHAHVVLFSYWVMVGGSVSSACSGARQLSLNGSPCIMPAAESAAPSLQGGLAGQVSHR